MSDVETAVYQWVVMGTHPLDGSMRFSGDRDEFTVVLGSSLVKSGHCVLVPGAAPGLAMRPEPSKLIDINISEESYLRGEKITAERSEVTNTVILEQTPAKRGK